MNTTNPRPLQAWAESPNDRSNDRGQVLHCNTAIATAYREHGYRLREIADYCGVHYATISRRLRVGEAPAVGSRTRES